MSEHELWLVSNAVFFIFFIILILFIIITVFSGVFNIKQVKDDWANKRCQPLIMPFASFFGFDAKENFNFCMGKIFGTHSSNYFGSLTTIFSKFSSVVQSIFNSINSIRNTIATLGGGINVIFQEFTERISNFFFKLRLSGIRLKTLFMRMYAILFSVMYMGLSGITGMTSFTNTFLFSFLDTFCFPGDTHITTINQDGSLQQKAIKDIQIGDTLHPGNISVTGTFKFYSKGQPMVQLGDVIVSTNHYLIYQGKPIKAVQHPHAIPIGSWNSDDYLYCLNTNTHTIPVSYFTFLDYDETPKADKITMNYIEQRLNATSSSTTTLKNYPFEEYGFGIGENTKIKTQRGLISAKDIQIGDELSTRSKVVGKIRKQVTEICELEPSVIITPSTLNWDSQQNKWIRIGEQHQFTKKSYECISFVVVPNSQIELENDMIVRDYMELCSPDSEMYYSNCLELNNIQQME
jgi:hypothetical protein